MRALARAIVSCQTPGLAGLEALPGPASMEEGWLQGQSIVASARPSASVARAAVPALLCQAAIAAGKAALQRSASNAAAQDAAASSQLSTAVGYDAPVLQHSFESERVFSGFHVSQPRVGQKIPVLIVQQA